LLLDEELIGDGFALALELVDGVSDRAVELRLKGV
jgi:hypothetical protein